jgi:hypothetical protein
MKKPHPYAQEIEALLQAAKESHKRCVAVAKAKRHYAARLLCHRTRMRWSEFSKEMQEYKTCYYIFTWDFSPSMYYSSYRFTLTEDYTMAKRFTIEDAVAISRSLPFETQVNLIEVPADYWKKEKQREEQERLKTQSK